MAPKNEVYSIVVTDAGVFIRQDVGKRRRVLRLTLEEAESTPFAEVMRRLQELRFKADKYDITIGKMEK